MEQSVSRRGFLGAAIGTGAAAAVAPSALAHGRHGNKQGHHWRGSGGRVPRNRISSQLYSWRRVMGRSQAEAERMLRTLAELGYTEVETAGHYGWTATQYRAVLDRYGLKASSGHDGPDFNFPAGWQNSYRATLEYAAELGQKFTGFAWHPGPHTEERYKFLAARFNEAGALAQEYGLQFFYHNHDFEFSNKQANGEPLYDILLNETQADLVKFELDLYWIVYGKEDPNRYLQSDPARWPLYHVKDKTWRDRKETQPWENWEDVGPGSIDFPQIFDSGDGGGLDKLFIIEHDWPPFSHPNDEQAEVKTAASGAEYLTSVRW